MRKLKLAITFGFLLASCLMILGLGYWSISPWFAGNGPANIGSIEISYVSMGRFLDKFFPHLSFAPYWYFGFPFHLFYTPLLPFLEAALHRLGGIDYWQAYRWISGAGYLLSPITLLIFGWYLTKKIFAGLVAGLAFMFLPSIFYFILPSGEVANDMVSSQIFDPRRLVILARWGEGPHTLSLVFIPLTGLFFLRWLEAGRKKDLISGAIFLTLTAVTNAVGLYVAVILLVAVFFSRLVEGQKAFGELAKAGLIFAAAAYGMSAFWYNPAFIKTFFGEGGGVFKNYFILFPWSWILVWLLGLLLLMIFRHYIRNDKIALAFFWWLALAGIVYIYYFSAPPELASQRVELAPQALRLMTGADMALALFLGVALGSFEMPTSIGFPWLADLLRLGVAAGLLLYGLNYLPYGQKAVSGQINLSATSEYRIARWLEEGVDQRKGERVFAAGNTGFYLNYFSDIWQLRGGLYQARTHPWPEHIYYQVTNGESPELALAWLRAANIKYLVVNTRSSSELYKDFKYPQKFASLQLVETLGGDFIYRVPLVGDSPVKIVKLETLRQLRQPEGADDAGPLFAYDRWLAVSRPAEFRVIDNDHYVIRADIKKGEGILVQMTFDRGFRAETGEDEGIKIEADPLGFILLKPKEVGQVTVNLTHQPTKTVWFGYLVTLLAVGGLIFGEGKNNIFPKKASRETPGIS